MKNALRFIRIHQILFKHGIDRLVWSHPLFKSARWLRFINPKQWRQNNTPVTGAELRDAFIELGPIFVKFGQLLSTRRDLLPDEIADELAKLQDKVPPFDPSIARALIEARFKKPITEIFASFETTPLASASIAQVHCATLPNGKEVIVKVLRPNIHKLIARDVALLKTIAKWISKSIPEARRFRPKEIVAEFEYTLIHELDLLREAANASQLKRNFKGSDLIYVPEIHWEWCHHDIMVAEKIEGIPISNRDALLKANINLKTLAERGVEIFFTQVFRDCFFHADMHPGNIFVCPKNPENPTYIAVDFGIMGSIGPLDQKYLASNFLSFFRRDYRSVARLHIESGWVPPYVRADEFEASIRTVCEPLFEKPLKDISFGSSLLKLFQTARQFDMEVQPQLLLLQKTLLSVEGLGKHLYPELDLWNTAKPFLEKWMKDHMGPKAVLKTLKTEFPKWFHQLPEIPQALYDVIRHQQHLVLNAPKPKHTVTKKSKNISKRILLSLILIGLSFILFDFFEIYGWKSWLGCTLILLGLVFW